MRLKDGLDTKQNYPQTFSNTRPNTNITKSFLTHQIPRQERWRTETSRHLAAVPGANRASEVEMQANEQPESIGGVRVAEAG
jgi:hypothetical protein